MARKSYSHGFASLGVLAKEQPEEVRRRRTSAEEAYSLVRSRLGAPGTYDLPGTTPTAGTGDPTTEDGGIISSEKVKLGVGKTKGSKLFETTRTTIDPEKVADRALGSTEGRIMSRLTAEAEQMVAREGPLFDEMTRNVQLPIIEGAAMAAQENAKAVQKSFRKGGAARRDAFEFVQRARRQERINGERGRALADARFEIDRWARDNARTQLQFNEAWASGLGGIRETYQQGMDNASKLMLDSAIPAMFTSIQKYAEFREAAKAKNRQRASSWITGALGVVSMAAGAYTGNAGLVQAGSGLFTASLPGSGGDQNLAPPTGVDYSGVATGLWDAGKKGLQDLGITGGVDVNDIPPPRRRG